MQSVASLILRVTFGLTMLIAHGWPKLATFSERAAKFPDPLGVGSQMSLILAVGAEVGCSILLILGLFTRVACIPLIITMIVAGFVIHGQDPWGRKELAFVYLYVYVALLFLGSGAFSAQHYLKHRFQNAPKPLRWILEA